MDFLTLNNFDDAGVIFLLRYLIHYKPEVLSRKQDQTKFELIM